jgi:hypothetical protein
VTGGGEIRKIAVTWSSIFETHSSFVDFSVTRCSSSWVVSGVLLQALDERRMQSSAAR